MKSVLVIIVVFNSKKYILKCIQSLYKQTNKNFEILIVDNASTDNSVMILEEKYPDIHIIKLGQNLGFAAGNNMGIRYALEKGYEYTLLLNVDTVVDEYLVERLLKYADPNTAVTCNMYGDYSLKELWYHNGKIDFTSGNILNVSYPISENIVDEVTFITGCCELVHKAIWEKIGLFNEDYFLYYEDTDLSMRMYLNGISMKCVHETWVWHRLKKSGGKLYYYYYMSRNKFIFLEKYKKFFSIDLGQAVWDYEKECKNGEVYSLINDAKVKGINDFKKGIMGKEDDISLAAVDKANKLQVQYVLLNVLCEYGLNKWNVSDFFRDNGLNDIAIYGNHYLGQRLCDWLMNCGVSIRCIFDRNSGGKYKNIDVCNIEDWDENLDIVIVTPIITMYSVGDNIEKKLNCKWMSIEDMLIEAENYNLEL